jgi:hypothetical protein
MVSSWEFLYGINNIKKKFLYSAFGKVLEINSKENKNQSLLLNPKLIELVSVDYSV